MKTSRKEAVLGAVILVGIILLSLSLSLLPSNTGSEGEGSVSSSRPLGRRGLYLLLNETGFDARAFADAPRDLPHDQSILWLPRAPTETMPEQSSSLLSKGDPERIGLHRLEYYKSFVEGGGTIVLAAGEDTKRFLEDALGLTEAHDLELDTAVPGDVERVRTSGGLDVELSGAVSGAFEDFDQGGKARAIWTVEQNESALPFAVEFPSGLGAVVVLASDQFVENRHIGEHQHALAALRLVEELSKGDPILFSEYEAGRWDPPSPLAMLFGRNLFLASMHGVLLLGLFVWMHGHARAFARDPEPLALFSPYLRARSLADVFTRGRRVGTLAALLRSGALARYRAIARLHPRRAGPTVANAAALPRVGEPDVVQFAREAGLADLEESLKDVLVRRSVANTADLDALDARLEHMEREIERRIHGRGALSKRVQSP